MSADMSRSVAVGGKGTTALDVVVWRMVVSGSVPIK
jgi:hypothetical protein